MAKELLKPRKKRKLKEIMNEDMPALNATDLAPKEEKEEEVQPKKKSKGLGKKSKGLGKKSKGLTISIIEILEDGKKKKKKP